MAVKIRLKRIGKKRQPYYRVVVADSRFPRDGRFIEEIGYYDPHTSPSTFNVEEERINYWLNSGAQPTDTVRRLLHNTGIVKSEKVEQDNLKFKKSEGEKA